MCKILTPCVHIWQMQVHFREQTFKLFPILAKVMHLKSFHWLCSFIFKTAHVMKWCTTISLKGQNCFRYDRENHSSCSSTVHLKWISRHMAISHRQRQNNTFPSAICWSFIQRHSVLARSRLHMQRSLQTGMSLGSQEERRARQGVEVTAKMNVNEWKGRAYRSTGNES